VLNPTDVPISQNSDEDQGASSPSVDEIDNLMPPGSASDHNPRGVCIPNHHPEVSETSGPAASNQGSFQPAPLELEEGEIDTGIYIPALQVTMKNIQALKNATLEEGRMAPADIDWLRDPEPAAWCNLDMSDTHLMEALWHFIYLMDTSCDHHETIQKVDMAAYPGDEFLSFDQTK
jgi:hypothetical protein